jgi:hypothetical protein
LENSPKLKALIKTTRATPYSTIIFRNGSELTARTSANRGEHLLGQDYDYVNSMKSLTNRRLKPLSKASLKCAWPTVPARSITVRRPTAITGFIIVVINRKRKRGFVYHGSSYEIRIYRKNRWITFRKP